MSHELNILSGKNGGFSDDERFIVCHIKVDNQVWNLIKQMFNAHKPISEKLLVPTLTVLNRRSTPNYFVLGYKNLSRNWHMALSEEDLNEGIDKGTHVEVSWEFMFDRLNTFLGGYDES